jgi:hypothetical protein
VCETNIVVLHDQTPQRISLPDHPAFLLRFSRRHHRSSRDVRIATKPTSLLSSSLCFVLFFVKEEKMPFFGRNLQCNFRIVNCTTPKSLETTQITACLQRARATHKKNGHSLSRMEVRLKI